MDINTTELLDHHTRCEVTKTWVNNPITLSDWMARIRQQGVKEFGKGYGPLFDRFHKRCKGFESGRTRCAFIFDRYVVKLPITQGGIGDNDWEGSVSNGPEQNEDEHVQYARTRMHYYKGLEFFPVVFMEFVQWARGAEIVAKLGHEPDWVDCVDCGQVGFNRAGKLVAFDYGIN